MTLKKMEQIIEELRPQMEAVPWHDDAAYANWLSQAYYIARRSTSYLGLCLFHSEKYPEFQSRCAEHIGEETGHEKLIENDLKHLGLPLQAELEITMAVYQPQYFRIVAENPMSFLGYVFFLELLAPAYGKFVMDKVSNPKAKSFLKVHTVADEDHLKSATEVYEKMPESLQKMAFTNFKMTAKSYQLMLEEIAAQAQVQTLPFRKTA